jgi:voltage-dependent potassium channel beta subunit
MSSPSSTTVDSKPRMTYRFLGDSGLLVSKLALGSWMHFDAAFTVDAWYNLMRVGFQSGINLFDTAEAYGSGQAEYLLGGAIKKGTADGLWSREDLVISTKIFLSSDMSNAGPNDQGLGRKHLVEGTRASLKRLQLDYVDVLFCHRYEPFAPVEEVVRAMDFIIRQGWAFYWGTSEWPAAQIEEACAIADRLHLVRPIVEQPQYNMLTRAKVEYEFADLYKRHKLGLTVWSPLAMGVLTGKYHDGVIPDGSRFTEPAYAMFVANLERDAAVARELEAVATQLGCSLAQLAIAWCMSNDHVSSVLLGARNPSQLAETLEALGVVSKLTAEVKTQIDAIVKFTPPAPGNEPTDPMTTLRAAHLG